MTVQSPTGQRFGAAVWDCSESAIEVPLLAQSMLPGSHVLLASRPDELDVAGIALRRAGFEIRDTITWLRAGSHLIVTLARAPMHGTTVENVVQHGVGALNIDACRIPIGDADKAASEAKNAHTKFGSGPRENHVYGQDTRELQDWSGDRGRFPTNVLLEHGASCRVIGTTTTRGDSRAGNHTPGRRAGGFVNTGADKGEGKPNARLYPSAAVLVFDCQDDCPVADVDARSGERPHTRTSVNAGGLPIMGGVGGASRYFPRFTARSDVWAWLERLITPPGVAVHQAV